MIVDQQSDDQKNKAKRIIKRWEAMHTARVNWETHWQECMENIIPRKDDVVTTRKPGIKRNDELFDSTAIMSNQLLAGALHGMLTNPANKFFELMVNDSSLDDDEQVKAWLQEVGNRMFDVMNNTNFQTEIHEIYVDLGAIGTATLFMAENEDRVIHFSARHIKEIFIDENNLGIVDTVYRLFKWRPKQIVQEFGEDECPQFVLKAYNDGVEDSWDVIHSVEPSEEYSKDKGKYFPFKSCYTLKEHSYILNEGGFKEFPYAVPRWTKTSGEIYGRGPGMDMLPDIKMLQKMMETTLQGAQKAVNPPMMVADDGVIGKVRLTPGGLTVVRPFTEVPVRPLITDPRIDFGYQAVEDVRKRIRSGFYVDQLQLNDGPQMTAAEVQQRTQEKLRLMGPILGRQHFEFLRPVIERVFGIMARRGLIPPAPGKIQGKKFDVEYSSLVARAQKMSEGQSFNQAMSVAAPVINADPKALDNIDSDKTLKYIFDIYGVPEKLLRSDRDIKGIRDARAKAQAQAAAEAQQAHQADVASKTMPGAAQLQQAQNTQNQGK